MYANNFEIVHAEARFPAYDERFCRNGGSYFQPHGTVEFRIRPNNGRITVEVDDLSCGDFGRRAYFTLRADGECYEFFDNARDRCGLYDENGDFDMVSRLSEKLNIDLFELFEAALTTVRNVAVVEEAEEE